mmetsp:Transcript_54711/g.151473  ORF Transcript_54711/g.151473 Transcript_54711/m.151473 type:complete len:141 (+) Transcript_54711:46-468(+)
MCSPNAEGTQHLIECLAREQRRPLAGNMVEVIPASIAANIGEQVGENLLMNGGELRATSLASQDAKFNEEWPRFYRCVLLPAAKECKTSVDIKRLECRDQYFTNFDFSTMCRCLKVKDVALAEVEHCASCNSAVWWRFSW